MLIVPIENKPDWSRPPVVTIVLILLNVFIYAAFQTGDQDIQENAIDYYMDADLADKEGALILEYTQDNEPDFAEAIEAEDEYYHWYVAQMAYWNPELDVKIHKFWQDNNVQDKHWMQSRAVFEDMYKQTINYRFAHIPAKNTWYTFVTSVFLHGDWGHLVGNMVFLFLFGFLLEMVLGRTLYLGLYLLTGVIASGFSLIGSMGSAIPSLGASGAISGLMGMYIVMYGLRKIKFFYTVGFYFGEFRAPALAILPLWLVKELYGYFYVDSNIGYMAHFGGLASGAVAMFIVNKMNVSTDTAHLDTTEKEQPFAAVIKRISAQVASLELDKAIKTGAIYLSEYPKELAIYETQMDTIVMRPEGQSFHKDTLHLLKCALNQANTLKSTDDAPLKAAFNQFIVNVLKKYKSMAAVPVIFKQASACATLSYYLFTAGQPVLATEILEVGLQELPVNPVFKRPLTRAYEYHKTKRLMKSADRYQQLLKPMA